MRKVASIFLGALLASCSHAGISPIPSTLQNGPDAQWAGPLAGNGYKQLYAFKSGVDAGFPYSSLTAVSGELYGTTYGGGGGSQWGTVYKVSTAGDEHVLYRFKAGNDGAHPYGALALLNGELYGTTYQGGTGGSGTIFKITTSGAEHVIYSFKGGSDGQYPYGRLLDLNGELYGTTYQGGGSGSLTWGTVFKVSPGGSEHVLYRFKAGNDGGHPYAGLTNVRGVLYGTTSQGGTAGSGTVFKVDTAGSEHVVYSFKGGKDGQYPYSRLLYYKGKLYGTTYQGGGSGSLTWGVVYDVTPGGLEHVLYRFKANKDGAHPYYCEPVEVNGELYGTTYQGGASGDGTIFAVSTSGVERILYSFKGGNDGQYPYDTLTSLNGALYGTTNVGGADSSGTVFKILP